jgi:hypothetical protein
MSLLNYLQAASDIIRALIAMEAVNRAIGSASREFDHDGLMAVHALNRESALRLSPWARAKPITLRTSANDWLLFRTEGVRQRYVNRIREHMNTAIKPTVSPDQR